MGMTQLHAPPYTAPYNGPPEHAGQWQEFARGFTKNGTFASKVRALEHLNAIAFGKGLRDFLESNTDVPIVEDTRTFNTAAAQRFHDLKEELESTCMANSGLTGNKQFRPLNHALTNAIMAQWTELRRKYKLFPITKVSRSNGSTREEEIAKRQLKESVLHTTEGALLTDMLWALNHKVIFPTIALKQSHSQRVDPNGDEVFDTGLDRVFICLFNFDPKLGNFSTYLQNTLRRPIPHKPNRVISLDAPHPDTGQSQTLPDKSAENPFNWAVAREQLKRVTELMQTSRLPLHAEQILRTRYGNGQRPLTFKQTGQPMGIGGERVRQIEKETLEILGNKLGDNEKMMALKDCLRKFFTDARSDFVGVSAVSSGAGIDSRDVGALLGRNNHTFPRKSAAMSPRIKERLTKYLRDTLHKPESDIEDFRERFDEFLTFAENTGSRTSSFTNSR